MKKLAACTAALALALVPTTADAHTLRLKHGGDLLKIRAAHHRAVVFDNECDSHQVWAEFNVRSNNGTDILVGFPDKNGCAAGGTHRKLLARTRYARLCEIVDTAGESCTRWYKV